MYLIRYKKNISTPIIDKMKIRKEFPSYVEGEYIDNKTLQIPKKNKIKVDEILKPSDMFLFKIKNNTINEETIEQHTRLKLKDS